MDFDKAWPRAQPGVFTGGAVDPQNHARRERLVAKIDCSCQVTRRGRIFASTQAPQVADHRGDMGKFRAGQAVVGRLFWQNSCGGTLGAETGGSVANGKGQMSEQRGAGNTHHCPAFRKPRAFEKAQSHKLPKDVCRGLVSGCGHEGAREEKNRQKGAQAGEASVPTNRGLGRRAGIPRQVPRAARSASAGSTRGPGRALLL